MPIMVKALQVGALVAVSSLLLAWGLWAFAPQKNANLLPTKTLEQTQLEKVSVPMETVNFVKPKPVEYEQPTAVSIPQSSLLASTPKPIENERISDDQPLLNTAMVNQNKPDLDPQPEPNLQQTPDRQQRSTYVFYGNPDQPGYQIQSAIFNLVDQGITLEDAAQQIIDLVINQNQVIRDALAMAAIAQQPQLSVAFVSDIAQLTALIDATKRAMENNPSQLAEIISLGVALYPDFTGDIITAAAMTGEMTEEEAILIAIAAGADPTLVASTTAAGNDGPGLSAFAAAPLGSGIGAGGTGGGDTTASTN